MPDGNRDAGRAKTGTITTSSTSQVAIVAHDVALGAELAGRIDVEILAIQSGSVSGTWRYSSDFKVADGTLSIGDTTPNLIQSQVDGGIGSPTFDVAAVSNEIAFRVTPANSTTTRWVAKIEVWSVESNSPYGFGSSLVGWWDATDLSAGSFTSWVGKAGNTETLTVDSGTASITSNWSNGNTQVETNGILICSDAAVATAPSGTDVPTSVIIVYQQVVDDNAWRGVFGFGHSTANVERFEMHKDITGGNGYYCNKRDSIGTTKQYLVGTSDTNEHILRVAHSGTSTTTWMDDAVLHNAVDHDTTPLVTDRFVISGLYRGGASAYAHQMHIAEAMVWDIELGAAALASEYYRLRQKWF